MDPTPQEQARVEDFLREASTWSRPGGASSAAGSDYSGSSSAAGSDYSGSSSYGSDSDSFTLTFESSSFTPGAASDSAIDEALSPATRDLLVLLSTPPAERVALLLPDEDQQVEFSALCDALDEWEQRPQQVEISLRERLRGLSSVSLSAGDLRVHTRESAAPAAAASGASASGASASGKSSKRRRRSGRHRTSARRSGVSRRRTATSIRVPEARTHTPRLALGILASAAGLLVALAAGLHFAQEPTGRSTAKVERKQLDPESGRRPLVSDLLARERAAQDGRGSQADSSLNPLNPSNPSGSQSSSEDNTGAPLALDPEAEGAGFEPEGELARGVSPEDAPEDPAGGEREREGASAGQTAARPTPSPSLAPSPEVARAPRWSSVRHDGGSLNLDLARLNGTLALAREGEVEFQPLTRREGRLELRPGDRLRSRSGGFASLDAGAFEVCLDSESELLLRGAAAGPRLALVRGRVHCEVRSLPLEERFTVATDHGDLSVLGTIFAVEVTAESTRVMVREGTVGLRGLEGGPNGDGLEGSEVKIGAGLASTVSRAAPSAPAPFQVRDLAWTKRLAPTRQLLYAVNFDDRKLGGFGGELEDDGKSGQALVLHPARADNPFWGQEANVPQGRIAGFRPGPDVYVQFSVFVEESAPVLFQAYNDKQKQEFKAAFQHPGGYWRTFTVPLLALSTYVDPGKNPVKEGDLFVDLEVYVGEPGLKARILLDDVQIYRRVYR